VCVRERARETSARESCERVSGRKVCVTEMEKGRERVCEKSERVRETDECTWVPKHKKHCTNKIYTFIIQLHDIICLVCVCVCARTHVYMYVG
jgi:hypothetical protein